jgi:Phage integrase family
VDIQEINNDIRQIARYRLWMSGGVYPHILDFCWTRRPFSSAAWGLNGSESAGHHAGHEDGPQPVAGARQAALAAIGARSVDWLSKAAQWPGKWVVRHHLGGKNDYLTDSFGTADDFSDADGVAVLSFWQAQNKAREKMVQRAHNGRVADAPRTVKDSVDRYLEFLGSHRKSGREARYAAEAFILPVPPINFHGLRHTWASHAVMNGMPLIVVAKNLGHTTTRMVEKHYGHLAPSYVSRAVRAHAPRFASGDVGEVKKLRPKRRAQNA